MTHHWWLISQDGKTILKVAAGVPGSIGSTSPSVSLIIVLYWTTDWLFFLDFTKKNPAVPIKDSTNRTKNATVDFEAPLIPLSDNNWRRNRQWLFHFVIEDVGGQRCLDSIRNYCSVSDGQNQVQIRNPDSRKPSRLKISDIDWQTPHSKYGQNPDSAGFPLPVWLIRVGLNPNGP